MKKILIICLCFISLSVKGQWFRDNYKKTMEDIEYKVDTLVVDSIKIPIERYNNKDLTTVYATGGQQEYKVAMPLWKLQEQLDYINKSVKRGDDYSVPPVCFDYIRSIKQANKEFPIQNQENELNFYVRFKDKKEEKRRDEFQIKMQKEKEEDLHRKKFEDSVRAERRKIQDSLNIAEQQKLEKEEKIEAKKEAERAKQYKITQQQKYQKRKEELVRKYGAEFGVTIANKGVKIGMTKEMCTEAWGKPYTINRTTTEHYVHEQWVYNLKSYLYFENDKLTSFQN